MVCGMTDGSTGTFHGTGLIVLSLVKVPQSQKGTGNIVPRKKGGIRGISGNSPGIPREYETKAVEGMNLLSMNLFLHKKDDSSNR